ncbi:MAG: hypothetical protein AB7Q17_02790 [Phycisphaerae bacterium]
MRQWLLAVLVLAVPLSGCLTAASESNPFLTLTETFGPATTDEDEDGTSGGGGTAAQEQFRRRMTVTLVNNHATADLNTSLVMWVSPSSIRSAEQQDALLTDGFVQLTRDVRIGSAFTLTPGTFVYNGPGTAGATAIRLDAAENNAPTMRQFSVLTPDVILVFSDPPVSCDSVAFFFTRDGEVLTSDPVPGDPFDATTFGGATSFGGFKTLAQVSAYECLPLRPGLFLKVGGGARRSSEYFEGENVRFDFFAVPDANGDAAVVTFE